MSWAGEEWKEGLSTRVLQKIQELESQVEKFKKERQQRQFQLESLEAALEKQKQKVEEGKNEGATLKRENQSLMELCDNLEKNRQKLFHELQGKESQINFQEGQLISSKKQVERLEQDLKRYKSELERQPKTFGSGDASFDNTPQRSNTGSPTPIYNDSKIEELQRKPCKEIEERKHLEAEPKSLKSQKKINPLHSEGNISRREIARHQASSSVFSWQHEQTPSRPLSSHRETPHSNGSTKSQFPWESSAAPSHNIIKLAKKELISCSVSKSGQDSSITDQLKTQNQELRSRIQELENKLQIQTQDMKGNLMKLQDTQLQVENIKMEFTEKEKTLNKARNEITKITIQLEQTTDQLAVKEEKFRKLSNELNCQKQNFESVQCALQQKIKDKDKEHQEQLEKNAKDCTEKLSQLEQAMQTMQWKENELKENYEEVKKQNSLLSCQSAEQLQEISHLKEELCSTKLFLQQSQHIAEDLKNKNCSLEKELKLLQEKLNKQDNSVALEKMRLAVSDVEHERDSLQQILKHKENIIEELNMKLKNMETLQKTSVECEGLKKEIVILSQWKTKSKQLLNELDLEKEELMSKMRSLESALMAEQLKHHEKGTAVKDEHEQFSEQLNIFEQVVKEKTTELEAQRKAYSDLQQKTAMSEEKLQKERENNSLKLSEFTKELDILQKRLQSARNEVLEKGKCIVSLEASLASHTQLNAFLQKQVEELVQTRDEMERKLAEIAEPRHQIFIQELEQQISKLREAVFQKETLLSKALSALEGKNKDLQKLIEESDRQQAEIQDLKVSNVLLKDLVQQLKVMSSKEPNASTEISLEQGETEGLQDESSKLKNTINILKEEILDIKQENQYLSKSFRGRKESYLELSQRKQEKSLLLPEADEEVERKCTSVEPKEDCLESAIRNQACHLKVQKAKCDTQEKEFMNKCDQLQNKLISLEKKKSTLFWQLEKNHSISEEAKSLRQEGTGQNNRHSSVNILVQKLISEIKASEHAVLEFILDGTTLEQLRVFIEEREDEVNKYQVKLELLQMDLEDREISIENYADQVKNLEMILRTMEIKMEESEMKKAKLLHKLQALKDLQNSALKMKERSGNDQSPMCFSAVIKDNFNLQKDAKCSSVPHDLMPSQNDYLQLVSSLHMTMSKLNELEKMCEHLQKEESTLASQLKDSQLECIISTDTMAKELMEKMNRLNVETISVSDKLIDKSEIEAQPDMEEMPLITPEDYERFDYEHLKLINKEIKTGLYGIKEKFFSLKNEYEIVDIQNLNMAFELSELQSCSEMLKEKNTALPIHLNKAEMVSFPIQMTLSSVNKEFEAYGKFCIETLCCSEVFPCTSPMLLEPDLDNDVSSTEMGGPYQNKQIGLEDTPEQFNIAGELYSNDAWTSLTKQVARRHLKNEVKHFQCECCENSFKMLKESFRSHKILEGEEIEKIQELLLSAKKELDGLQKQSISDNEHWQQKLQKVILQVASELPAEKKLPQLFPQKQGELQNLDLSSHPIICADTDQPVPANQPPDPLCYLKMDSFLGESLGLKAVNDQTAAKTYEAYRTQRSDYEADTNITSTEKYLPDPSNANDQSIHSSDCPLESFLPSNLGTHTRLVNSMENQKAIEMLWLPIKKADDNNSRLFHDVEESNKIINTLLMKVQYLHSDLNSKNTELSEKEIAFAEYNKTVMVLKQEKEEMSEVLQSVTFDKQQLSFNPMYLGIELNKVKSELEMYKIRWSDSTHTLEELQMTKADNTEKLLEAETEQRRIKSEKTNFENYTLSMEADAEELLSKNKQLEQEKQINLKIIFGLCEHLQILTAGRNQSSQDLITLSRDKDALDQVCNKIKKNIKELDSNQVDTVEYIKALEAEDKTQVKLLQAAKAAENQLSVENVCYMVRFQNLDRVMRDLMLDQEAAENQIKHLTETREVSLREYEILHSRLSNSEAENAKISKSLEGSLVEKGELAARLNSAQEEADQLREGIEKLKVKIESDERNRHHLAEKLKENKRKADTLTDKIEYLERELHMSEESFEDAVLRMETAKAETEIMKTEIERMCVSQQHLEGEAKIFRSEKETLEKELKEKQDKVISLEMSNSTLVNLLKENEKEKEHIRGECENALRLMESQLKKVYEEIKILYSEKETFKSKEQDLICEIASLKHDNMQLMGCLEEAKSSNSKVQQLVEAFIQELQSFKQKLNANDSVLEPLFKNEALQAIQDDLQVSFERIEEKLEVTPCEKYIFLGKANSLNQMLQLKEEYDSFCHSFLLWLNAYRMLKQEKAVMEKQIHELETQLKTTAPRFQVDVGAEEIRLELKELKESVEEKTKEANHNLEKYCTLIINHDKLEEENEMLRTQVSLLNTCLKQLLNDTSSSLQSSQSPMEMNSRRPTTDAPKIIKKGEKCEENRSNEYSCPCISHPTSLEPRMDSCLFSPSLKLPTFIDNSHITEKSCFFENLKTTAEGSRLQKMNFATDQVGSSGQDFTPRSPLSICNLSSQEIARRSADHLDTRNSPSTEENELDKACHVQ
ncbi:centromere protein F [Python bivittatus]|uniref:Centromere protein F n=1 Tax=Python bivittatus TaxID=176946 RepID=A0A9F5MZV5_PYTBI|nr:centromere protein F [Python bivittatus]